MQSISVHCPVGFSRLMFCVCVVNRGEVLGARYVEETANKDKGHRYLLEMVYTLLIMYLLMFVCPFVIASISVVKKFQSSKIKCN